MSSLFDGSILTNAGVKRVGRKGGEEEEEKEKQDEEHVAIRKQIKTRLRAFWLTGELGDARSYMTQ